MKNNSKRNRRIAIGLIFLMTISSFCGPGAASSVAEPGALSLAANRDASDDLLHIIDADETATPLVLEKNARTREDKKSSIRAVGDSAPWLDDKGFADQWHLGEIGAPEVWTGIESEGKKPGEGIVVAVIDTGVDTDHYDLKDSLWTNIAEKNGIAGVDDDNNGYVDDIYGANVVNPGAPMDDTNGHGTQMAGIIAMGAGNGGAVGVAYGAKIMPVKVAVGDTFSSDDAVKGIRYAVANGADIISMSYSTTSISLSLYNALKEASSKCILVAAAGNEALTTQTPAYPAAYNFVVGVMSYGRTRVLSSFSNWDDAPGTGDDYDIAAPGEDIVSTIPDNYHAKKSGTSHATALVSGAMAVTLERLRSKGEKPDPYSFQIYFIRNMLHWTQADAAHNYLLFPRPYLPDVIESPTTPLVSMTPIPSPTPVPTAVPTALPPVPTVAPTVVPTVAPSIAPTQTPTAGPATTVPVATGTPVPTAVPIVSPSPKPTNSPSGNTGKLAQGLVVKAGSGAKKAFYRVKNPSKKTVVYYLCNVGSKKKTAQIPAKIRLSDRTTYKVVGVKKRSFVYKKNVKRVNVYSSSITPRMMKKATRGSHVSTVIFK